MSDDSFNMSVRKFLKTVGVTSQQKIEEAVRNADSATGPIEARVVLTIESLGLRHEITGTINPPEDS